MINSRSIAPCVRSSWALVPCLLLAGCAADALDRDDLSLEDQGDPQGNALPPIDAPLTSDTRPSQVTPGFGLEIEKNAGDIELTWVGSTPGALYDVLASPRAYFNPGDGDVQVLATGVSGTSITLAGADDGTTVFYRVLSDAQQASQIVGKTSIDLVPNFSVLPVCLLSDVDDSNALFADVGSPTALSIHRFNSSLQSWEFSWPGGPDLAFGLGDAVGIRHLWNDQPNPDTYTLVGAVPAADEMAVALVPGENGLTTPLNTAPGLMASDLLPQLTAGQRIGRWDNSQLDYQWYPADGDFPVSPCMGLRLDVSAPSVFPGCDSPSLQLGAATDNNWYSGGPRAAEQGTHGVSMGDCPAGYVVVGAKAYEGGNADWTDGIGTNCREITIDAGGLSFGADSYFNWYFGGPRVAEQGTHGGDPGTGECPAGSVVVGVQYFEGGFSDWVDGIGVHCQQLQWSGGGFTFGASTYFNWYFGGPRGGEQGTHGLGAGDCPPGQVVAGMQYFEGGLSDWVDGVGIRCRDLEFEDSCLEP